MVERKPLKASDAITLLTRAIEQYGDQPLSTYGGMVACVSLRAARDGIYVIGVEPNEFSIDIETM